MTWQQGGESPPKPKKHGHPEEDEQKIFVADTRMTYPEDTDREVLMTCSPAGFKMPKSLRMIFSLWARAMGYRPGTSDVWLLEPRGPYHGLFIEFKRPGGGVVSKDQRKFMAKAQKRGFAAVICHTAEEAKRIREQYLKLKIKV
jgi:hypothetical protein